MEVGRFLESKRAAAYVLVLAAPAGRMQESGSLGLRRRLRLPEEPARLRRDREGAARVDLPGEPLIQRRHFGVF